MKKELFSHGEIFVTDVMLDKYKRDILPNHGRRFTGEREREANTYFLHFLSSDIFRRINASLKTQSSVEVNNWGNCRRNENDG